MQATKKKRLDQHLVDCQNYNSRSRARDAINRGCVRVDDKVVLKPSLPVSTEAKIHIEDAAHQYVSRSALKLVHALELIDHFVANRICLDVGASTGGFTQVLLEAGAKHVFALDVGHDQLVQTIKNDPRVTDLSGNNSKDLSLEMLDNSRPKLIVCDVSFISVKKALPPALTLGDEGAKAIILIKPQFEVGREHLSKKGLVKDEDYGHRIAQEVATWLNNFPNWHITNFLNSPILGGDGNREYLAVAEKN